MADFLDQNFDQLGDLDGNLDDSLGGNLDDNELGNPFANYDFDGLNNQKPDTVKKLPGFDDEFDDITTGINDNNTDFANGNTDFANSPGLDDFLGDELDLEGFGDEPSDPFVAAGMKGDIKLNKDDAIPPQSSPSGSFNAQDSFREREKSQKRDRTLTKHERFNPSNNINGPPSGDRSGGATRRVAEMNGGRGGYMGTGLSFKEICGDFQRGRCFRGDSCKFAHVMRNGQQDMMSATTTTRDRPPVNNVPLPNLRRVDDLRGGCREVTTDMNGRSLLIRDGTTRDRGRDLGNINNSTSRDGRGYYDSIGGGSIIRDGGIMSNRAGQRDTTNCPFRDHPGHLSGGKVVPLPDVPIGAKVELCQDFRLGLCNRSNCKFLHMTDEQAYRLGFEFDSSKRSVIKTGNMIGGNRDRSPRRSPRMEFREKGPTPRVPPHLRGTPLDECADFRMGRCFRGVACKYRHVP